ncbi:MAG TPA: rhodanese-like domain-containing protein [Candidatus Saccharimonadaceae bacterium]|nr:rhodanese-like domain-containing protein [Candidatus Saccharimonadaceae bacterium]
MNCKKIFLIIAVVLASLGTFLYLPTALRLADQPTGGTSNRMLSPQQMDERLKDENSFVLNVHTPYEGEIRGTDAFIAYDTISKNSTQLPQDKSAEILVYCRTGQMSAIALQKLKELGYTNVYDLAGGMEKWKAEGFEVISLRG